MSLPLLVRSPDPEPGATHILFVCHANQCRSPFAEAIAKRLAGDLPLHFSSGGLIGGGQSMPSAGRHVGAELGFDFSHHRSREVDLYDFGGFDLVLAMARPQARELLAADPVAWPRIFTLKQFSRWVDEHPPPRRSRLGLWLDAEAADRDRSVVVGTSEQDDVADPIGQPAPAWRSMVGDLTPPLSRIVSALGGS